MTAMNLHRYPSASGGVALGKIGAGVKLARKLPYDSGVEYLESTGTQWIDTGVLASSGTTVECDWMFLKYIAAENSCAICAAVGSGNTRMIPAYVYNGRFRFGYGVNNALGTCLANVRYKTLAEMKSSLRTFSVDGSELFRDTSILSISAGKNFTLFMYNGASIFIDSYARIYQCKIWRDDALGRDFIPVRFTNELGQSEGAMFDRANPTVGMNRDGSARTDGLYRNRGTGAFLYGNDI